MKMVAVLFLADFHASEFERAERAFLSVAALVDNKPVAATLAFRHRQQGTKPKNPQWRATRNRLGRRLLILGHTMHGLDECANLGGSTSAFCRPWRFPVAVPVLPYERGACRLDGDKPEPVPEPAFIYLLQALSARTVREMV
jgi:hypothetical protein